MATTGLQDSDEEEKTGLSPANQALDDQRKEAAGETPGQQAQTDQLNAAYRAPSAEGHGADRGPGAKGESASAKATKAVKQAADTVGKGFSPEYAVASKAVGTAGKVKSFVLGNSKSEHRNRLISAGLITVLVAGGALIGSNWLLEHEFLKFQALIEQEELKLLEDGEKHALQKVGDKVIGGAKDTEQAKEDEQGEKGDPLSEDIDAEASDPHAIDTFLEEKGLTPVYDGKNLVDIQDSSGQSVVPEDGEFSDFLNELTQEDVIKTGAPIAVSDAGAELDVFPESDPDSNSTDETTIQKELTKDIDQGATDNPVAQGNASETEQEPQQTNNQNTNASNASAVNSESQASGPLEEGIKAADAAAAEGATAATAVSTGVSAFKAKLGASFTDKFAITGMITMFCTFEKAIQTASNDRIPTIMGMLMRNGGLGLAFGDHQKNSGGGPANVPVLKSEQVKAFMDIVVNNPNKVTPTSSNPDPQENMPPERSAELAAAEGRPVTNTTNPTTANYTPALTAAATPSKNAGQQIVDLMATFMRDTGLSFACSVLTSTFGVFFQLAAGLGQLIASIGSFGADDAAVLAVNVALQQFLFNYVLPQAIAYFTNLGVGLTYPVQFINNMGAGVNLLGGSTARYEGAMPLTHDKDKTLEGQIAREQFIEEQHQPLMYRAFAVDNPYSITSHLIEDLPTPTYGGVFASVSDYFVSLPSIMGHVFSDITSPRAFADSGTQLNPNTMSITQYHATFSYDPKANEYYLRDPSHNPEATVSVDGKSATRIQMLGDPYAYALNQSGDPDNNDLLHCFVDSPLQLTDMAGGNPAQQYCGALGSYDYADDDPSKLGLPNDQTVVKLYCNYFGNPPDCANIVTPQVHDDVDHYSQYLGYKAAMDAWKGIASAN